MYYTSCLAMFAQAKLFPLMDKGILLPKLYQFNIKFELS